MSAEDRLTYDELEDERDRLARELYKAQCRIEDQETEISRLRNAAALAVPFTMTLTANEAAPYTHIKCWHCAGWDGTHMLGCPQLSLMNTSTGSN